MSSIFIALPSPRSLQARPLDARPAARTSNDDESLMAGAGGVRPAMDGTKKAFALRRSHARWTLSISLEQ
jgi:hypothetical protein